MYRAPHTRHRISQYKRENKNLAKPHQEKFREMNGPKPHQEKFREMNGPRIKRKRRPKREVISGFKMSYRYKYYQQANVEEDEDEEVE